MGSDTERCPRCGGEYQKLGNHWTQSSVCGHPELTEEQKGVINYLHEKKGYGTVEFDGSRHHPKINFGSSSRQAVEMISGHLDWIATSIETRDSGYSFNGGITYRVRTRRHPWFRRYLEVPDDG